MKKSALALTSGTAVFLCLLALNGAASKTSVTRPVKIKMAPVLALTGPTVTGVNLRLDAMSPWTTGLPMDRDLLDKYFGTSYARYSIESTDQALITRVAHLLEGLELERDESGVYDLRYRISIGHAGKALLLLYMAADGRLHYEGNLYQPRRRADWLVELWKILRADEVYAPFPGRRKGTPPGSGP